MKNRQPRFYLSVSFQLASAVVGVLLLLGLAWYTWAQRYAITAMVWRAIPEAGRGTAIVLMTLSAVLVGVVVYGVSEWLVFRPLHRLTQAIDLVRSGEYRSILPRLSRHQLGGVGERFRELLQQLADVQETLGLLFIAARTLTSHLDIDEVLQQVLEMILQKFDVHSCAVYIMGEDGFLRIRHHQGLGSAMVEETAFHASEGICGRAYATNHVQVMGEARSTEDALVRRLASESGVRSVIFLPLLIEGRTIGVLNVNSRHADDFPPDRVKVLSAFTEHLAIALRNARLYAELQQFNRRLEEAVKVTTQELTQTNVRLVQRVRELKALYQIAAPIAGVHDLDRTLKEVADITTHALEADMGLFFLFEETRQVLVVPTGFLPAGVQGPVEIPMSDGRFPIVQAFREGKAMLAERLGPEEGTLSFLGEVNLRAHLVVPLKVGRRPLGVLWVGRRDPRSLTEDHLRLGELIADRTSVIIENVRLYERLQRALEELERLNRMKTEFISMVSHELRTPVTTIKGVLALILGGEVGALESQQQKFLTTAAQAVDRLMFLISDLLDISRIEAGQIKMRPQLVPLGDLIVQATGEFQRQAKEKHLTFRVDIPAEAPRVMGDPDRLFQVVSNLLANAIKFTPSGGHVTVSAQDQGEFVMISVADTGPGIPPEEQERVFEKFYQIDSSATRSVKGSGLGLAIVKSIVELHGGRVWVESKVGHGTTFRVVLPRVKEPLSAP
ncbi:MAG: GAF domain-containing sensor histidine kinase [Elusimicrobia bacterium]|nr:GAF domain-containing sensor histidine kinase [Elusimicrobiota bacterium]